MAHDNSNQSATAIIAQLAQQIITGFGLNGQDYIVDTTLHKGRWISLKAEGSADVVFEELKTKVGDDLSGSTLKVGDVINGNFTQIKLTSGKLIAYRK